MRKLKKFGELTDLEFNAFTNTTLSILWVFLISLLLRKQFIYWRISELSINWAFVITFSILILILSIYVILNIKYVLTKG